MSAAKTTTERSERRALGRSLAGAASRIAACSMRKPRMSRKPNRKGAA
jgi:hypothetical protein